MRPRDGRTVQADRRSMRLDDRAVPPDSESMPPRWTVAAQPQAD